MAHIGRWHDAELDDPQRHISPLRPHDLRHTFAFQLARQPVRLSDCYSTKLGLDHFPTFRTCSSQNEIYSVFAFWQCRMWVIDCFQLGLESLPHRCGILGQMANYRNLAKGEYLRFHELIELLTCHTKPNIVVVFSVEKAVAPAYLPP